MTRKEAAEELRDLIVLYEMQNILPYLKDYHMDAFRVAIDALEQQEPCEDAVSRVDVLECFSDLYDTFEDCSKGIVNELHRKFEDLRTLPSVSPKPNDYKTDHGYMWICPDCGLVVHSDFKKCVRCGHKREE